MLKGDTDTDTDTLISENSIPIPITFQVQIFDTDTIPIQYFWTKVSYFWYRYDSIEGLCFITFLPSDGKPESASHPGQDVWFLLLALGKTFGSSYMHWARSEFVLLAQLLFRGGTITSKSNFKISTRKFSSTYWIHIEKFQKNFQDNKKMTAIQKWMF